MTESSCCFCKHNRNSGHRHWFAWNFGLIIIYLFTPIVRSWCKQLVVMAACHCNSWWMWWWPDTLWATLTRLRLHSIVMFNLIVCCGDFSVICLLRVVCKIRNPDSFCPCVEQLTFCMIDFMPLNAGLINVKRRHMLVPCVQNPNPTVFGWPQSPIMDTSVILVISITTSEWIEHNHMQGGGSWTLGAQLNAIQNCFLLVHGVCLWYIDCAVNAVF
jgi:hypothetical protein